MKRGYCLVSQQIRERIVNGEILLGQNKTALDERGKFCDETLEKRVQPSSFEPTLGDEIFILGNEVEGIFRPRRDEQIYRTLLQLPMGRRIKASIANGFEIKRGFSYLVPLQERVKVRKNQSLVSSPKSSIGRTFLDVRMMSDYNPSIDEIDPRRKKIEPLQLWLLLQPIPFDEIIGPGLTLNQLRFFEGIDAQLTPKEILEEHKKHNLIYNIKNGKEVPVKPLVTRAGLQASLDLVGRESFGIVGFKARSNPIPIDLRKTGAYNVEDYFDPIENKNAEIVMNKGDCCLFSSKGLVRIPMHLSAELKDSSVTGFRGRVHLAGFLDNNFQNAQITYEFHSHENSPIVLEDGMTISNIEYYRTSQKPDKGYGEGIGSNYQGQKMTKPAKYFKSFDSAFAAKFYKKLDRMVLVQDANYFGKKLSGVEIYTPQKLKKVEELAQTGFFLSRYDIEGTKDRDGDELVLQFIPYALIFGKNDTVFSYVRPSGKDEKDREKYGDELLFGKHSIGIGSHVISKDAPQYLINSAKRSLANEVNIEGKCSKPKIVAGIKAFDERVDRVHYGFVPIVHTEGKVSGKEMSIQKGRMINIYKLMHDPNMDKKYETWSKMLIPLLPALYALK